MAFDDRGTADPLDDRWVMAVKDEQYVVIGAQVDPPTGAWMELQLGIHNSRAALPYVSPSPYALSIYVKSIRRR